MAKYGWLLIGLFLLGGACASPMGFRLVPESSLPGNASNDPAYQEGLRKLASRDYAGAELAFRQSLANHSDSVPAMLGLAEVASRLGRGEEVAQWMHKAVSVAPNNYHAQLSWGRYLRWIKKDLAGAQAAFRKAATLKPDAADAQIAYGDVTLLLGQAREAVGAYERAVAIAPKRAAAHYALGIARLKTGDSDGALASLEKAGQLAPANPLPYLESARIHLARGATDRALQAAAEAQRRDPGLMAAALLRAQILAQLGQPQEARSVYQKLIQQHPRHPEPLVQLAMLQQQLGKTDPAITAYRRAIELDPEATLAYNNLAWLLGTEKQALREAIPLAEKAVKLAPGVGAYRDTLGWLYWLQGRKKQACATYREGLRLAPEDPSLKAHWKTVQRGC